jgi:hypothetical protein
MKKFIVLTRIWNCLASLELQGLLKPPLPQQPQQQWWCQMCVREVEAEAKATMTIVSNTHIRSLEMVEVRSSEQQGPQMGF